MLTIRQSGFLYTAPSQAIDPDWDRTIAERTALESADNLSLLGAWNVHMPLRLPSSGGLASARESLGRGLGSRWFAERFHRNALVTHFQHGRVFCTGQRLEDYTIARRRLHQRAPEATPN